MAFTYSFTPFVNNTSDTSVTVANPCFIVVTMCASDGDNVHRSIDAVTIGGNAMTQVFLDGPGGQNNQVAVYTYLNTSLTGSQTLHRGYHSGPAYTTDGIYIFTAGYGATQPDGTPYHTDGTGSNPAVSGTTSITGSMLIELVCGSNSITAPTGFTSDTTGSGNGSSIIIGHRILAGTGSYSDTYTMASASYAIGSYVVASSGGGATVNGNFLAFM
jgi:hypothetical protein